jgi:hypothetical protein
VEGVGDVLGEEASVDERKRFFFEKKKQKTFIHWSLDVRLGSNGKRFLLLFFIAPKARLRHDEEALSSFRTNP